MSKFIRQHNPAHRSSYTNPSPRGQCQDKHQCGLFVTAALPEVSEEATDPNHKQQVRDEDRGKDKSLLDNYCFPHSPDVRL